MTPRTDPTVADLERQIAQTREALGQTVEELAAKVDVPSRAKAKARETADRFRAVEDRTRAKAGSAATAVRSRLPGNGGASADATAAAGSPAESGAHRVELVAAPGTGSGTRDQVPTAIVAGAGLAVLVAVTWARRRAER